MEMTNHQNRPTKSGMQLKCWLKALITSFFLAACVNIVIHDEILSNRTEKFGTLSYGAQSKKCPPYPMAILIFADALKVQSGGKTSGISRIWVEVIPHIAKMLKKGQKLVVMDVGFFPDEIGEKFNANNAIVIKLEYDLTRASQDKVLEKALKSASQLFAAEGCLIDPKNLNSVAFSSSYGIGSKRKHICSVTMIYDMIPEHMKDAYYRWPMIRQWKNKETAMAMSNSFISISESTKRYAQEIYGIPGDSISVIFPRISSRFQDVTKEDLYSLKVRYNLTKPYFMIIGDRHWAHKNPLAIWAAYSHINYTIRAQTAVMITNTKPAKHEERLSQILGVEVYWVQLNDTELCTAYSGSLGLMYTSLEEGFGIPIIEAMSCGAVVITDSGSGMIEAGGNAAYYVNTRDPKSIAAAMTHLFLNPIEHQRLVGLGYERIREFGSNLIDQKNNGWKAMANEMLKHLYNSNHRGKSCDFLKRRR